MRTRIKICGITRAADAQACAALGADAIGLVFYRASPRAVEAGQAARLVACLPPFVTRVGLFVNPAADEVDAVLSRVALDVLQFHGDEEASFCASFGRPFIKAARVRPGLDLLEYAAAYAGAAGRDRAQAILCDAFVEGYGGGGEAFDWNLVPRPLPLPLILSGGLNPGNVAQAIRKLAPAAVDVSSGVEIGKGIKDAAKIAAFINEVRAADESLRLS
jgi:phosphoribosylanthranilate isomerase